MANKLIGERIEAARKKKNLTQDDIAKELGFNKSTIQRYESGVISEAKLLTIQALADYLGVAPDWLVGKTDDPTSKSAHEITDSQLKFALFGDAEIDDDVLDDIRTIAKAHAERKSQKTTK